MVKEKIHKRMSVMQKQVIPESGNPLQMDDNNAIHHRKKGIEAESRVHK